MGFWLQLGWDTEKLHIPWVIARAGELNMHYEIGIFGGFRPSFRHPLLTVSTKNLLVRGKGARLV